MPEHDKDTKADFDAQGASARPGGEARDGIDQPQERDGIAEAQARATAARADNREGGFGDDKGADIS